MSYRLSKYSLTELQGVHPALQEVVKLAIGYTSQDFKVFDGLRTKQEQLKYLAKGTSKTRNSYHLYGLAVDLVPIVNGKMVFEIRDAKGRVDMQATLALYKPIAEAVKKAMYQLHVQVDWLVDLYGWDMPHFQITKLKGKDARLVYDYRRGGYYA